MKPLTKSGGLVDFKENIIFQNFKDTAFSSINQFKYLVYKKYHYIAGSDLYRKVVNYQVDTYGTSLNRKDKKFTSEHCNMLANLARNRKYNRRKKGSK